MSDRSEKFGDRPSHMNDGERGGDDERGRGGRGGAAGGGFRRRKVCRFCTEKEATIDYRDAMGLKYFISERGKIVPRRISGNCAKHQREMAVAVKRARAIALIPYAITT